LADQLWPDGWWRDPERGVHQDLWRAYEDFRVFLFLVWKHLNLPDPTPLQYDIATYVSTGPKRRMIRAFRGVGKSWITVAYVVWRLLRNPDIAILVVSASKIHADNFTTFCMRIIYEMPMCRHLIPKEGQRQSKIAFDVGPAAAKLAPSVKSVGITGQIAGSRADLEVIDDIEIPNNSETQLMRDKLLEQIKEFDAVLKPGGEIVYLGTPQNEQSIYNTLPERGYKVRIWTARYPSETQMDRFGDMLAPFLADQFARDPSLVGKPTDPLRFTAEDLMEREASYGRAGFALQFMLDTSLSDVDKFPLKVEDLIVMSVPKEKAPIRIEWAKDNRNVLNDLPNVALSGDRFYRPMWVAEPHEWTEFDGCVMFVDPSGRGKDETAYAIVRFCQGMLWLVASGGFLGGYDDTTLRSLAMLAKGNVVNRILVEPNFGDGMFTKLLRPVVHAVYPCTVEDAERAKAQKEARIIDTLEPVLMQHRLVIDPKVIEQDYKSVEGRGGEDAVRYRLIYQLTRVTRDRGALVRDDRLDALAGAVAYWLEYMDRDTKQAQRDHIDRLREMDIERFMQHAVGGGSFQQQWSQGYGR
jgi:hypothetical protein